MCIFGIVWCVFSESKKIKKKLRFKLFGVYFRNHLVCIFGKQKIISTKCDKIGICSQYLSVFNVLNRLVYTQMLAYNDVINRN